jgi:hypothetical protein
MDFIYLANNASSNVSMGFILLLRMGLGFAMPACSLVWAVRILGLAMSVGLIMVRSITWKNLINWVIVSPPAG